ncbi:MAG: transcription antitermination factor NusB [Geodermatophilaceae bacterium]|nr:transcription antitermination factor NusB [Geodermatophilaceae bacterium]
MSARRKARKRALDVLFEADLRGLDAGQLLADRAAEAQPPIAPYAQLLVDGVVSHQDEIDNLISAHAHGWTLPRLPGVDRALLRIAIYEVLHCPDVPDAVAIDEAIELAKSLSTDESAGFLNGVLGAVVRGTTKELPTAAGSEKLTGC